MLIGVSAGSKSCISTRMERRTSTNPGFEKNSGLQGPFVRDHWITRRARSQFLSEILMGGGERYKALTLNSNVHKTSASQICMNGDASEGSGSTYRPNSSSP